MFLKGANFKLDVIDDGRGHPVVDFIDHLLFKKLKLVKPGRIGNQNNHLSPLQRDRSGICGNRRTNGPIPKLPYA